MQHLAAQFSAVQCTKGLVSAVQCTKDSAVRCSVMGTSASTAASAARTFCILIVELIMELCIALFCTIMHCAALY